MTSSETSIDAGLKAGKPRRRSGPPSRPAPDPPEESGFRPWHFFVIASLMAATAAVVVSRQPQPAGLILVSLTVGAVGLAGLGCYRMIAPLALDEEGPAPELLSERSRAGLEREKMLVLRSIKDLEFDRAMGKVSESDFEDMAARLRARAITLMKRLDDSGLGYRQLVEQELRARLGRAGVNVRAQKPAGQAPEATAEPVEASAPGPTMESPVCAACGTSNDEDAKFCKQCGQRIAGA